MSASPPCWILFCEAAADARMVQQTVDALLSLYGEEWVRELLPEQSAALRSWWSEAPAREPGWIDLHAYRSLARELSVAVRQGHFDGEAQKPDAVMMSTLLRIARRLAQKAPSDAYPTAVVVLRDQDDDPKGRRGGFEQAQRGSELPEDIALVVGLPIPEREAWVLAGFDPEDDTERTALEVLREELGFSPNAEPERLTSGRPHEKKDSKRVMATLGITEERERRCVEVASPERRALIAERGARAGLAEWLEQLEAKLVPQVDPSATGRIAGTQGR